VVKRRAVAVIGGGLAGLACALAAARAGAAVELLEERPEIGNTASHVDVVPNMLRDLVLLGVGDACVRAGFPYRRTSAIGQRGTALFSLDADRLAGPRYPAAMGITQASLQAVLADAAAQAGVVVRAGARVLDVEHAADSGARVVVAGCEAVQADVALLACGARGGLRERVFHAEALPGAGESFHFLARRPRGLDDALHAASAAGDRAHVVPVSGSLVGVRLATRSPHAFLETGALRTLLARFPGPVGTLATHVEDGAAIAPRAAKSGLLPQPWARGAVIAVGDCAHALPPHFGQSAAQGIEDAVVLGQLFAQGPDDLAGLSQAYLQRRVPRVQQVLAITLQAARWDFAPHGGTDFLELARSLHLAVREPA
jgi:2-polyprenyl-6-methoxyphenol hydroxylase-like FAD-dependent oxidoreductase